MKTAFVLLCVSFIVLCVSVALGAWQLSDFRRRIEALESRREAKP